MRILLVALCAAACAMPDGHRLSFPDAPPAAFTAAQEAAAEWNACPGVSLRLLRGPGGLPIELVPAGSLGAHSGSTDRDGWWLSGIRIDERYATRRALYAHEFGHVLALEHTPSGVMHFAPAEDAHVVVPGDCP